MKLTICAKCSDSCNVILEKDGAEAQSDGYVPESFGIGGGDYIELDIDLETGKILNWQKPHNSVIDEFIEKYRSNND